MASTVAAPSTRAESAGPKKSLDVHATGAKADYASSSDDSPAEGNKIRRNQRRSLSRKRASLFGSLLGRKSEHGEKKVEPTEAKTTDVKTDDNIVKPVESGPVKESTAPALAPATTEAPTQTVKPVDTSVDAPAIGPSLVLPQ